MMFLFRLISKKRDLRESELGNVCSQLPLVFIVSDAARESCIFIVVRVGSSWMSLSLVGSSSFVSQRGELGSLGQPTVF